jgi:hypothetical protein
MGLFNSVQGVNQTIGAATSVFGAISAANNAVNTIASTAGSFADLGAVDNLRAIGLPTAGEAVGDIMSAIATFGGGDAPGNDWRVRLSLPKWPSFRKSPVLKPLTEAGGCIFPYTPAITITQSTNYNGVSPVHNNYAFNAYKNSDPGSISIVAPMYCEDSAQALYWIAMLHYLRATSKMFSGNDPKAGNPPPIVNLNAYGNFVFKNVPVVITGFTVALEKDCDYIGCNVVGSAASAIAGVADTLGSLSDSFGLDAVSDLSGTIGQVAGLLGAFGVGGSTSGGVTHVPTKSTFTVTLKPSYSRTTVRKFSLDQFVTGGYMSGSTGFV